MTKTVSSQLTKPLSRELRKETSVTTATRLIETATCHLRLLTTWIPFALNLTLLMLSTGDNQAQSSHLKRKDDVYRKEENSMETEKVYSGYFRGQALDPPLTREGGVLVSQNDWGIVEGRRVLSAAPRSSNINSAAADCLDHSPVLSDGISLRIVYYLANAYGDRP